MSATAVRGGQVFIEIGADPKKFFAALNGLQKRIGQMGASLTNLGTKMAAVGTALALPLGLAMRNFAQFDDAIRATGAVSGASSAELQRLNDVARNLGATTSFTAVQVANLMTELGRAGFSPKEIENMTGAVLNLARATGTDAALSAGIMAATLRQFGLGATEATRAADVLTATANKTFNTVEGLGESLKYAGPVAKELGLSLEDTAAILGVLGNVGIQGSEAGTALRRLGVISAASGEKLQELFGISNQDAAGNLKPLITILDEINDVTANMPVAERTKRMAEAFGLLGITSANVLSQSAGGVADLAAVLRTAQGTAAKTAKEMDAGLGGSMRITLSAIEGTALAIGDALEPSLKSLVDGIGNVATGLTKFVKENKELIVTAVQGIAIFTGVGLALLALGGTLTLISGGMGALIGIFTGVAAAVGFVMSPIGLLIGSLAAIAYFGPQIAASFGVSFGGISAMVDQASAAIGGGFGDAVASAAVVFSDLGSIASTTFSGIYEAIADGDLSGAMDILWLGLVAGWNRGTEALMGLVDPWIETFQNIFADVGTEIVIAWENMWSALAQNSWGQYLLGFIDNIVNTAMATFDWLVGSIQKAWAKVQDFITGGNEADARIKEIDNENAARAEQRAQERPGIEGRTNKSDEELARMKKESEDRVAAMRQNNKDERTQRSGRTQQNREDRRRASQESEQQLGGRARKAGESRVMNQQFADLLKEVEGASSIDQLRDLYGQFDALSGNGRLSSTQAATLEAALEDAQERVSKATGSMGGSSPSKQIQSGAAAAGADASASTSEVAGTFSAAALGSMGFGSSLAQQSLEVQKKIEENTRVSEDGAVAA